MKAALARPSLTGMHGTLTEGEEVATELLAERKQVTVLFCDVADSLSLAGSLDPEVWRSILTDFLEIFREEIERLDGTVDKFTGDGAMAIFGAPVAQEDHAVRACRVALRLRASIRERSWAGQSRHRVPTTRRSDRWSESPHAWRPSPTPVASG